MNIHLDAVGRVAGDMFAAALLDLDQAFEATKTFKPMDKAAVAELLARSRPYALKGKYELFKTSATFDGTAKDAAWLGEDVEGVKSPAPTLE